MATRRANVPAVQQPKGVIAAEKHKAGDARADGKNRRALGDIGNRVNVRITEGKQQQLAPNRPITRSFGAQLLANAQAVAAANAANKQKSVVIPEQQPAAPKLAAKETKKPDAVNRATGMAVKAAESDLQKGVARDPEKAVKAESVTQRIVTDMSIGTRQKSSRKNIHTMTSVLTARSKMACGIVDKKSLDFPDIDASDSGDQLAVVEYVEDIYKFYKMAESTSHVCDYMDSQLEINAKMRAILADWIIEVHHRFELMPETLYLTMHIIDRYLSQEVVHRRELQLVGVSSMLIACKYEEIWAPEVNDFICISERAYTRHEILRMEKTILNKLQWNLTVPTPYVFLVRFLKASARDDEMKNMVFFFAELALMQYSMIMHCPSMLAASAVYAARCTLQKTPLWTESLKHHTGFSEQQLIVCAQMLVNSHSSLPESKLKIVYKKYSGEQFGAVALRTPATKLIDDLKSLTIKDEAK